jgi:hypothetical protein
MINIHYMIVGGGDHVHDELELEVEPSIVADAVKLVQISMEGASSLLCRGGKI